MSDFPIPPRPKPTDPHWKHVEYTGVYYLKINGGWLVRYTKPGHKSAPDAVALTFIADASHTSPPRFVHYSDEDG